MTRDEDPGLGDRLARILRDEYELEGVPPELEAVLAGDVDELLAWAEENAALELLLAETGLAGEDLVTAGAGGDRSARNHPRSTS